MNKLALSNDFITRAAVNTANAGGLTHERAARASALGQKLVSKGSDMIGSFAANKPIPPSAMPMIQQGAHLQKLMKVSSVQWAEQVGRSMAHADAEKAAEAMVLEQTGIAVGEMMAKSAGIGSLGTMALEFAKKNPGAAIGGGLGALHGLMNGGVTSGILEGAGGAVVGHGVQAGGKALMARPDMAPHLAALKAKFQALKGAAPEASEVPKVASPMADELQKIAFGAVLANLAKSAIPAITNYVKSNPLKAAGGALSAFSNFRQARQSGEGLGSSLLSGAAGGASMLG